MDFLLLLRDSIRSGLSQHTLQKHAKWLAAQQRPEGGFANRRGRAELYYTTFALRSLSVLAALTPELAAHAVLFLSALCKQADAVRTRQPGGGFCDAVAAVSWWDSMRLCEEAMGHGMPTEQEIDAARITQTRLNALRREDGGWAKTDMDACGSVYHTFLAACVYTRMSVPLPDPERAAAFLDLQAHPDGGYLENRFSKRPGTNGSAAGIALGLMLGLERSNEKHAEFLAGMYSSEGGFYATPAAPIADLLSTYTALFTLTALNRVEPRYLDGATRYVRSLECAAGGYLGFALETIADCEYTFYGLGVESIINTANHGF